MTYTWESVRQVVPDFIRWAERSYGCKLEGPIDVDDYAKYLAGYIKATR